jgi:cobalt-zinc-cadmium efflux system protein
MTGGGRASGGCGGAPGPVPAGQAGQRQAEPGRGRTGCGHALTVTGRNRRRLVAVLAISAGILVAEVIGAIAAGSLVLLADAAHMAADVAGIGLSLLAAHVAARPATARRTFGYARAEILAAAVNAMILLAMAAFILVEAIRRLMAPAEIGSGLMIVFGMVALAGNSVSVLVLSGRLPPGRSGDRGPGPAAQSLNLRGTLLEVASDTLGALAVIVTGLVIATTGLRRADPVASLAVAALILPRTWRLLREALDVLLEASPESVDLSEVRHHLTGLDGVRGVHDLHAWTITSGLPVLSAHIVVDPAVLASGRSAVMLDRLQECLSGHFDVEHSTFQLEPAGHADHEHPMHR